MTEQGGRRRVVVTGIGPVSPVGIGLEPFWSALTQGKGGITHIQNFDPSGLPVQIAGEVHEFDPNDWMDRKEAKRADRVAHFAVAAARLA